MVIELDSYKKTRIQREIAELEECIQVIDWNIDQKIAGMASGTTETTLQQSERRSKHCDTIADLRKQLEAMK
jgi:hypothetical protein